MGDEISILGNLLGVWIEDIFNTNKAVTFSMSLKAGTLEVVGSRTMRYR